MGDFEASWENAQRARGLEYAGKEKQCVFEGALWYEKSFTYAKQRSTRERILYFGAVKLFAARIYLKWRGPGRARSGFTPLRFRGDEAA